MKMSRVIALFATLAFATALMAEQAAPQAQGGQAGGAQIGLGQRAELTPAEREAQARQRYEQDLAAPNPIPVPDTVWMEELTYLGVRDGMKAGKTVALIFAAGMEENGPYLALGKHQYQVRVTSEVIARKLGNALIAPIITLESGNPDDKFLSWGSIYITEETFRSILRDMARSLKSQGFENIFMMGDSGSNAAGLAAVSQELTEQWKGNPGVYHIREYYDWDSVRKFITDSGIPEKLRSDGIHDEYSATALLMAHDPKLVNFDARVKAGRATINGVNLVPKEKTIEFGKKIANFRADKTVEAIERVLGAKPKI